MSAHTANTIVCLSLAFENINHHRVRVQKQILFLVVLEIYEINRKKIISGFGTEMHFEFDRKNVHTFADLL